MKKTTITIILIALLAVGLAAIYAKKPNFFQGSAFQKFDQDVETLPGEEPVLPQ